MKYISEFNIVILLLAALTTDAQQRSFKFDFGTGKAPKGYIAVDSKSIYSAQRGYGFSSQTEVKEVCPGIKKSITTDYITGSKSFYFPVKLPEGNYDVKLMSGDVNGTSATTVRAECRRLFLQNIQTKRELLKRNLLPCM